ncbi:MAG: glycosyltransferase [Bacteroidota bacterium]
MAKILHISKYYYPYYGGIEDVAQTIVRELKPFHTQKIICFNDRNITETDIVEDVEVYRIATVGTFFSQPIPKGYHTALKKLIKEFKPDYIHLHMPNPVVTLFLLNMDLSGIKLYIHWHADISGQKLLYSLYKDYENKLLLRADKIIATSQIYLEHSEPLRNFLYKSVIVPNTINEQKFPDKADDADKIEQIRKLYGNKKILFFVGRHVPYKGIEYLIECEKLVDDDCVFVVAGKGPLTKQLKTQAAHSDRIKFIGKISDEELRLYLKASYLFLFPSINRSEAFGVALAEALYCGLPAVSFDIEGSGVTWVNKNNYSGVVVKNFDKQAFARSINELLKKEDLRAELSRNAKSWVSENFLTDKAFVALHEIYRERNFSDELAANVSIVLYNNKFDEVKALVSSLRGNPTVKRIFLIDNSEIRNDDYLGLDVTYVFNDINLGYGRGHNIALRQTLYDKMSPIHIVMNADVHLEPEIIDNIVAYMCQHTDVAMLMPKVYYPNNKIQYLCRLLPTPIDLFGRRFLPKRFMRRRVERLEMRHTDYNKIIEVPHISGCFMTIRTEVLEKSGLFDERFFLYLEDVDLTRRISKWGKTIFYPKVHIVHKHNRGSYSSFKLLMRHITSAYKYFRKWGFFSDKEREVINRKIFDATL